MKKLWISKLKKLKQQSADLAFEDYDNLDLIKSKTKIIIDGAIKNTGEYYKELNELDFKHITFGSKNDENIQNWEADKKKLISFLEKLISIVKDLENATLPQPPENRKVNHNNYWIFTLIGFVAAAILLFVYFKWYRTDPAATDLIFYLILLVFGSSIGAMVFGLMGSSGRLEGSYHGVNYKFSGVAAGVILVVVGYFLLPRNKGATTETSFAVRVFHNNDPLDGGRVRMFVDGFNTGELPITNGQTIFSDIPTEKLRKRITIIVSCPGYVNIKLDTLVFGMSSISLNMEKAGKIKIKGKITSSGHEAIANASVKIKSIETGVTQSTSDGKYSMSVENVSSDDPITLEVKATGYKTKLVNIDSVIETNIKDVVLEKAKNESLPKLGVKYHGGIVFFVEKNGEHGLIVAEKDQGVEAAWMITPATMPERYHSMVDGFVNSENLVRDQGPSGGYAALLCRNFRGGGYNDWFLPAFDQLMILYQNRNIVKNMKPKQYWSSTGNGPHAWFLDFSNMDKNVARTEDRYAVRAIREF